MTKVRGETQKDSIEKSKLEAEAAEALQTSLKMQPKTNSEPLTPSISSNLKDKPFRSNRQSGRSDDMESVPSPS